MKDLFETLAEITKPVTNYEAWQLKTHGNVLNEPTQSDELENGRAQAEAFERWVNNEAEFSFMEQQF